MKSLRYISIAGFLVAVLGIIALYYRKELFGQTILPISVQVAAAALMIWARIILGIRSFHAGANATEGGLVTSGPYRYWRHPIYAAIIYFTWAGIFSHFSYISLLLGSVVIAGLFIRIFIEEKLVTERYPEYDAYAKKTKRIIPFIF